MVEFTIKDSGQREHFTSGMVRDTAGDKVDYTLVLDGPMFERWAQHLTIGAVKYAKRNWMLATGGAEYERFKESAVRHFIQWYRGDPDEDHAAAVLFNINGAEYVRDIQRHAEAGNESARSASLPAPASQRSSELVDHHSPLWGGPRAWKPGVPLQHSAPIAYQADCESEHHMPGPNDEGQTVQSADRPQPKSPLNHTDKQ